MATIQANPSTATHTLVPLQLSGNTTEQQNKQLQESLGEAVRDAYRTAIEQLDRHSAQAALDMDKKLKREIAAAVVEIIHRHTVSDKYKDEEVDSNRIYPPTYRVRPVEAQVTELRKLMPSLGNCHEKLARKPLVEGAEAWFAIPRWQAVRPLTTKPWRWRWGCWPKSASSPTASSAAWDRPICARASAPSWRRRS
jgi:hypothetical protein